VVTLRILFALTIALSLFALNGCDDDNSELNRNAISVSAINEGGIYVSATWDAGPDKIVGTIDDFQPFSHMPIRVKNRPYNEFITNPDFSPYGDFRITNIKVEWVSIASGDQAHLAQMQAFNFEAGYYISVPSGSEVIFNVLLVPFYAKGLAPMSTLEPLGATPSFVAVANITLTGHDSGSTSEIEVASQTMVEFIGLIVSSN